ncbi:MAG: prepilin-type N-terminal cleavage/methylation domain-containing protein [Candidatus Marinimicrobia bacterium]|nr:prepilin-type N-terminal cleavage/methylation domain-containing protein [Candidatus Neomarinimicrobiota bacterium]MBT3496639.1 prepilin-type N-terminal cleavage/methylation domain-containing protein [Candidatus Neomarinimicrobiota bacterium]MBT3692883.1 prepilin-type N-terminal cleavage/methylation domain-containing protein [Candidatus Neomarinimicrobiota bacterium]MBT3732810.1 prepilin-type N-terminal cleavage/methylation domain-containing protein [Candidatus Neomarinimicrobiota bacterium]M
MKNVLQRNGGFTFIEVMTAFMIISIASVGMMMGAGHAQGELRSIELSERATEELLNFTEYWKGRIADGRLSPSERIGNPEGKTVLLRGSRNSEDRVEAKLFYDLTVLDNISEFGNTPINRVKLETWIRWDNFLSKRKQSSQTARKRRLETIMMVF